MFLIDFEFLFESLIENLIDEFYEENNDKKLKTRWAPLYGSSSRGSKSMNRRIKKVPIVGQKLPNQWGLGVKVPYKGRQARRSRIKIQMYRAMAEGLMIIVREDYQCETNRKINHQQILINRRQMSIGTHGGICREKNLINWQTLNEKTELINNCGTITRSGTKALMEAHQTHNHQLAIYDPNLEVLYHFETLKSWSKMNHYIYEMKIKALCNVHLVTLFADLCFKVFLENCHIEIMKLKIIRIEIQFDGFYGLYNLLEDEIENNPSLFQYGEDPNAEDFLAQFYDFKRSSGAASTGDILHEDTTSCKVDIKKSKKESIRKRHKSEASSSIKENENLIDTKPTSKKTLKMDSDDNVVDKSLEPLINEDDNFGIVNNIKESTKTDIVDIHTYADAVMISKAEVKADLLFIKKDSNDDDPMPKLRSKSLSSKITTKRKLPMVDDEKSEVESESLGVSSDNLEDEDFRPAKKSARVPKKYNIKVTKIAHQEQLLKEEKAIKEASKLARKKSRSQSNAKEDAQKDDAHVIPSDVPNEETKNETFNDVTTTKQYKCESSSMATMVNIEVNRGHSSTEISKNETDFKDVSITEMAIPDKKIDDIIIQSDYNKINEVSIEFTKEPPKHDISESISSDIISDKVIGTNVETSRRSNKSTNKKSGNKSPKKELMTFKKQSNNRKRRIVESEESDEEVVVKASKKSKMSHRKAHTSDDEPPMESTGDNIMPSILENDVMVTNSSLDENISPKPIDKVKALHSFNSDIRSSLILGHEDYDKCVDRFKSLCTMDIDLISLVTVWQLMDTVKKCRRYKRNELVKNEAQNVYKRFLEIHLQSSPDELQKAQTILAQFRQSQNNAGSKSGTSMNGHAQNQLMPTSVDDMFHPTKPQIKGDISCVKPIVTETKTPSPPPPPPTSAPPTVVPMTSSVTDEEKMRLLSADLEAKVSDILNKIEKNSVSNPINRQSMSHLLPARSGENDIPLPVEWESVDSRGRAHDKMSDDDDDEEDVEAIVKRIEDVPIKTSNDEEDEDIVSGAPEPCTTDAIDGNGAGTSALDARIENLFNASFVSGKDASSATVTTGAKSSSTSNTDNSKTSKKSQKPSTTTGTSNTRIPGLSVSPTPPSSDKASPTIINIINDDENNNEDAMSTSPSLLALLNSNSTAADSDIYDLLGV